MQTNLEQDDQAQNPEVSEESTSTNDDEQTSKNDESSPSKEDIAELKKQAEVSSQNYERLKKEQEKRKELEEELEAYRNANTVPSHYDDPDTEIQNVKKELQALKDEKVKTDLLSSYPILKEKWEEFEEFHSHDGSSYDLAGAAKIFLVEKDLLTKPPQRKGLEKQTGGARSAPTSGKMTAEDAANLRKNNHKKYMELLQSGKLEIE